MSKPLVRFIILDTHMGLGHDGLREVIAMHKKKNPLFARALKTESDLILFINRPLNAAKLFAASGNVIGYLRLPYGRVIDERAVGEIPATFGGSVEYSKAVKAALQSFVGAQSERASSFAERTVLRADAG